MAFGQSAIDAPVCFPPDPNPRTPRFKLPPKSWDTHFHVIGPIQRFPEAANRWITVPAAPIEHYLGVSKVLGFERGVAVLHSCHGDNPASVVDAIEKSDRRLRGIIRASDALDRTECTRLHAAGVRCVRVELRKETMAGMVYGKKIDPRGQEGMFEGRRFDRLCALAAKFNWPVEIHIDPDNLIRLADVLRRVPTPVIIDNFASIDARLGLDQPSLKTLLDLAAEPHIWQKNATMHRMAMRGATLEQILSLVHLVHSRAPDRVVWGTDWPHPGIYEPGRTPNDGDIVDMLTNIEPDGDRRHKLLVDNPKRLFDF